MDKVEDLLLFYNYFSYRKQRVGNARIALQKRVDDCFFLIGDTNRVAY